MNASARLVVWGAMVAISLPLVQPRAGGGGAGTPAGAAARAPAAEDLRTRTVQEPELALAIAREVERIARSVRLWPGFAPLDVPLAIYTGSDTYLFRHPQPPGGFDEVEGARPPARRWRGRHPAVTSNSSADIGGVASATLLADGPRAAAGPLALAATALHEAFHVHQRARHPRWIANEGDLLRYPEDNARILGLRRLETAAWQRALEAPEAANAACWTRAALRIRAQRFEAMDSAFATYERASDLNEGLATYVQIRAAGRSTVDFPGDEFGPGEVRDRAYVVGPAQALLLDRLQPGWHERLIAGEAEYLDAVLEAAATARRGPGAGTCGPTRVEAGAAEQRARRDIAAAASHRAERLRRFESLPGWRVVVEAAPGQPLWPQGFDPLNLERVPGGVLHHRLLRLGNDAGDLRMVRDAGAELEALTEAAGEHPLFNGVRRATVAGLGDPAVEVEGRRVRITAPGFDATFRDAALSREGGRLLVRLGPP